MLQRYVRTGHLAATGRQALLHPLASDRARRDCRRAHRRLTPVAAAPDRCRSAVHRHNRVRRRICQRPGSRDIQEFLIDYVANFVGESSGSKFNPHVTTGVGTTAYLDEMLAEPRRLRSPPREPRFTNSALSGRPRRNLPCCRRVAETCCGTHLAQLRTVAGLINTCRLPGDTYAVNCLGLDPRLSRTCFAHHRCDDGRVCNTWRLLTPHRGPSSSSRPLRRL
jgi:hypothetical protein